MSVGRGVDIAAVYQLLREVADRVIAHDDRFASFDQRLAAMDRQFAELRTSLADVHSDVGALRTAVTEYHASVLGHGILISELDTRLRRVEEHLKLPPAA